VTVRWSVWGWVPSVLVLGLASATPIVSAGQQAPNNLQYFPSDITRDSLVSEMRQFSFALGVRCQYCHVGGDGVSLEGVVWESDEDPDKRKARFMLRLVDTLNEGLLPMMAGRDQPRSEITCKTCHRGLPKPRLLTDVLRAPLDEHGADSVRARYLDLRENEALSGRYDFRQWEMNTLAERLTAEERYREAIAVYEVNLEQFPESVSILLGLGQLYEEVGDEESAVEHYRRVLDLAPDNRLAAARLEALGGR